MMSAGETAKKGCLGILTVFMIGFGSCVGLVVVSNTIQGIPESYNESKDNKLALSVKKKIENNTATSDELALYSEMLGRYNGSYKLKEIIEPNLNHTNEINSKRIQLLTQSANQDNVTGKVLLANLLFDIYELERDDTVEMRQEKVKEINRAVNVIYSALEQTCNVNMGMNNLRYGRFHNYVPRMENVVNEFAIPLYRIQEYSYYDEYLDLQKSAKVLLLRDAIRCGVYNLIDKELSVDNVQYLKAKQLVFEFVLAELTGNNERINLIKQVNSEQPTDEIMQQVDELVKAYRKKYGS